MSLSEQAAVESVPCLNGPCQGAMVDVPPQAIPGAACALMWETSPKRYKRYAIYVLVEQGTMRGLMYIRSYDQPERAQDKVDQLTAICTAALN